MGCNHSLSGEFRTPDSKPSLLGSSSSVLGYPLELSFFLFSYHHSLILYIKLLLLKLLCFCLLTGHKLIQLISIKIQVPPHTHLVAICISFPVILLFMWFLFFFFPRLGIFLTHLVDFQYIND